MKFIETENETLQTPSGRHLLKLNQLILIQIQRFQFLEKLERTERNLLDSVLFQVEGLQFRHVELEVDACDAVFAKVEDFYVG